MYFSFKGPELTVPRPLHVMLIAKHRKGGDKQEMADSIAGDERMHKTDNPPPLPPHHGITTKHRYKQKSPEAAEGSKDSK